MRRRGGTWAVGVGLAVVVAGCAAPACAQMAAINVPAAPLSAAIRALAEQSGAAIGAPGSLAAVRVRGVKGKMPVATALHRMLRGTGLRAKPAGPGAWRIEAGPRTAWPAADGIDPPPGPDIIVTATKQPEPASRAALALSVADARTLAAIGDAPDAGGVATILNGLSSTNLGSGRDRLFLRGIGDSPFDGFGQSSVSVQLDEARLTYDAPDPDLRLIDMAQVELLKGPQGPLYGTGALGGVYRLVPEKPMLDRVDGAIRLGLGTTAHGGMQGAADVMANVPVLPDRLAVRLVGYRIGQSGWIDEAGRGPNVNRGESSGGRIAIRAKPTGDWTVDLVGVAQGARIADSQYVEQRGALSRAARLPEPQETNIRIASLTATGPLAGFKVTGVVSTARQELDVRYDASARATLLGGTAPATYRDDRRYEVANAELRAARTDGRVDWLAGASLLVADTNASGDLIAPTGEALRILRFRRSVIEAALFGEATYRISPSLRGTLGLRLFRSAVADERREVASDAAADRASLRGSPSAALAWQANDRLLLFARIASALRPGGIQAAVRPSDQPTRYRADTLRAIDLGLRWQHPATGLSLDLGLFTTRWSNVQADFLRSDGLVITRNAGFANNTGIDTTLGWRPDRHWTITTGLLLQRARIGSGVVTVENPDRRLPVVPDVSAHGEIAYGFEQAGWAIDLGARASFVGNARLSFDPGLDRQSQAVTLTAASITATRGRWTLRLGIDNILDTRANSFAFGNPFSIALGEQNTPVRPRTSALSVRRRF